MLSADKLQMFENRLKKVFKHRSKLAQKQQISCWRVYDHDLPEFPFCIEIYGLKLYLAEYLRRHGMDDQTHDQWLQECIQKIASVLLISSDHIYLKQRRRKANRHTQYEKTDVKKEFFVVKENNLKFRINLTDYLDTGLFLDHRITRKMVMDKSANKKVLNLFCYTGSFSVYAAAGGAATVVSIDLSKTYLDWAKENFNLNQIPIQKHQFIHADVLSELKKLPSNFFDLVVVDPPTFSNSKRMDDFFEIQRDHVALLNNVLKVTKPGGEIYFSTNFTKFVLDEKSIEASSIKDITKATTPFDFEGKLKRYCFLISK